MSPAPDVSSVLLRLIDAAERVVCCRSPVPDCDLAPEISHLQSPVGAPLSAAPGLLLGALIAFNIAPDKATWRMIIGCLLPLVRDDLGRVIEARKRPLEPDQQAYRGVRQ